MVAGPAPASPLTYVPVNPSFGGNPLNGSNLLNEATAVNKFTAPVKTPTTADRLAQFATALQNAILSRVSSALIANIVGVDGKLVPGTVETQNFIIGVVDQANGTVQITTTDKTTGQSSVFQISNSLGP